MFKMSPWGWQGRTGLELPVATSASHSGVLLGVLAAPLGLQLSADVLVWAAQGA